MKISFLSRVAFICNICLVLALFMGYYQVLPDSGLKSTVIVCGYLLSFLFNAIVNIWAGLIWLKHKKLSGLFPMWLFLANFLFFIFQLYLLLK